MYIRFNKNAQVLGFGFTPTPAVYIECFDANFDTKRAINSSCIKLLVPTSSGLFIDRDCNLYAEIQTGRYLEYDRSGKIASLFGTDIRLDRDGRIERIGGIWPKYDSDGRLQQLGSTWIYYDSYSRALQHVGDVWFKYDRDGRIESIDRLYVYYDHYGYVERVGNKWLKYNSYDGNIEQFDKTWLKYENYGSKQLEYFGDIYIKYDYDHRIQTIGGRWVDYNSDKRLERIR